VIPRQLLQYALAYVPPYVLVAGGVVFGTFHVWSLYNDALINGAAVRQETAKAFVEDAKAQAAGHPVHMQLDRVLGADKAITLVPITDEALRVKTMRAEVAKKQHDAELAQIEADAQNSRISDETAALAKAKADLYKKQQEAANAKIAADAVLARFGVQTLADRAEFVKFVGAELDNMNARHNVAAAQSNMEDSSLIAGYAERQYPSIIEAQCKDNSLAKYLGCPKRYWQ